MSDYPLELITVMANEIFISYSRADLEKARSIKETIDHELGIDCWMDLDGIESDKQFVDVIVNAIIRHKWFTKLINVIFLGLL